MPPWIPIVKNTIGTPVTILVFHKPVLDVPPYPGIRKGREGEI
jgi:hypothetical protein